MNRRRLMDHSSGKKYQKRGSKRAVDCKRIHKTLKKFEPHFSHDHDLMTRCSEFLVRENKLGPSPNPSNVCNWVLRWMNMFITLVDGRNLLTYVSLQMSRHPSMRNCALLPPSDHDFERWCDTLAMLTRKHPSHHLKEDTALSIYSAQEHLLHSDRRKSVPLNGKEAAPQTLPPLQHAQSNQEMQKDVSTRRKKNSAPEIYGKYRAAAGKNSLSVADMVTLAKSKQQYRRMQRLQDEKEGLINYNIKGKDAELQPHDVDFNEKVDSELFGGRMNTWQIRPLPFKSNDAPLLKSRSKYLNDSDRVKGEVYQILGVRADNTVRQRNF